MIKPKGLGGLFSGNLVRHWVDVSEGGLKAIVSHEAKPGEVLQARISHKPSGQTFMAEVSAQHTLESEKYPGAYVVGFRFLDATTALRSFIRDSLCQFPAVPRPNPPKPGAESQRAFDGP